MDNSVHSKDVFGQIKIDLEK